MKRTRFILLKILFAFGLALPFFGSEKVEDLLAGYLTNDLELASLSGKTQKAILENQSNGISYGFSFTISSGTIVFTTGDNGSVSFTPNARVSLPQLNNLSLSASTKLLFDSDDSKDAVSDTSISLSADILSNRAKNTKIALLRSERNVLNAKRNLQNGFISAEKNFYSDLKSLYNLKSQVLSAQEDAYESQLSFDQVRAQGYSSSSSKYRTARLKLLSDQNTVESRKRDFEREVKIFASKCGVEYAYSDPSDFLPSSIPAVEALDIRAFDREDFLRLENARWNQYISGLERSADSAVTLSANAGMTFNPNGNDYNTVDVGSDFTWNSTGLKLSAGASIPVGTDARTPVFTMGVSLDPNAFRKAGIDTKIQDIDARQEEIEIQTALEDYDTAVISQESSLQNILWEKDSAAEFYDMYKSLASDMAGYYRQGLVSESEYRKNAASRDSYEIRVLVNALDMIIYNDSVQLLFCPDIEDLEIEF